MNAFQATLSATQNLEFPMGNILENEWFVSIVASLIATLISFGLAQVIKSIQHKKLIYEANTLVLNQLRVYLINADIPSSEIFVALKSSAARRFHIKESDLLPSSGYIEEIVAEIVGNTYLSIRQQEDYLRLLDKYLRDIPTAIPQPNAKRFHWNSILPVVVAALVSSAITALAIIFNVKQFLPDAAISIMLIVISVACGVVASRGFTTAMSSFSRRDKMSSKDNKDPM